MAGFKAVTLTEGERGVFTYEGQMVDGPVFKQAEQILRRAN